MFNKNEIYAFNKGYRITKEGVLINKLGNKVKGYNKNGYNYYKLRRNDDYKKYNEFKFSRLQAYQKYGNNIYKKGTVVRHLNGIRDDDSWDNIAIGTQSENMMDKPKDVRMRASLIAASYNRKYDVIKVREYYNKVKSYRKTQKHFGISSGATLHNILHRPNIY